MLLRQTNKNRYPAPSLKQHDAAIIELCTPRACFDFLPVGDSAFWSFTLIFWNLGSLFSEARASSTSGFTSRVTSGLSPACCIICDRWLVRRDAARSMDPRVGLGLGPSPLMELHHQHRVLQMFFSVAQTRQPDSPQASRLVKCLLAASLWTPIQALWGET